MVQCPKSLTDYDVFSSPRVQLNDVLIGYWVENADKASVSDSPFALYWALLGALDLDLNLARTPLAADPKVLEPGSL